MYVYHIICCHIDDSCMGNNTIRFLHVFFEGFIKGDRRNDFSNLQIRYKKGANPVLKLLDDTNTVQDTLA